MTEDLTVLPLQPRQKFKFSSNPHCDTICSIKYLNDAKNYFDPNPPNCTRLRLVFEFKQTFIEALKLLRLPLNANGEEYENMLILIKLHQVTRKYLGNQYGPTWMNLTLTLAHKK